MNEWIDVMEYSPTWAEVPRYLQCYKDGRVFRAVLEVDESPIDEGPDLQLWVNGEVISMYDLEFVRPWPLRSIT